MWSVHSQSIKCEYEIFVVEIMSRLKLDHHEIPGGTARPFRLIVGLLSSAHLRSRLARSEPKTYQSRAGALNR